MAFFHLSKHLYLIRIRYGDDVIIGFLNRLWSNGMWTEENRFVDAWKP